MSNFTYIRGQQLSKPSKNVVEIVDRLLAMRQQEDTSYAYSNYFPQLAEGSRDSHLNVSWREKICQWSYNVVDHFDLSREIVAISLDLFDRFLATRGNECDGSLALLTSLTTLHIAIKLNETTKKIKLSTLANLSRGQFETDCIEKMEWTVVCALGWKLHPPTPQAFIANLLLLLPPEASPTVRKGLSELSKYFAELAVCDSFFVDVPNSVVAFSAIVNVMEDTPYAKFSGGLREKFLSTIAHKVGLLYNSPQVVCARFRLRKIYSASNMAESLHGFFASSGPSCHELSQDYHHHKPMERDNVSMADRSMASADGSLNSRKSGTAMARARTSSFDSSKGSCRYSPSARRPFVASVSPLASTSRAVRISSSPTVAAIQ